MAKRKSLNTEKLNEIKNDEVLYIISEERDPIVEDYLPEYTLKYEGKSIDEEAEDMVKALKDFIRENDSLVLKDYTAKDNKAVQEGFSRAIAITELFFRHIYLSKD